VTVKIRYSNFETATRSRSLDAPTARREVIRTCAGELLRRSEAGVRPVRLLGLGVSGLVPAALEPTTLFAEGTV
jgi:DNA polymerase-4